MGLKDAYMLIMQNITPQSVIGINFILAGNKELPQGGAQKSQPIEKANY